MGSTEKLDHKVELQLDDAVSLEIAQLRDELVLLQERQADLDGKLRDAANRQRFSSSAAGVEQARDDERKQLVLLDRLMTRIRAVEGKLLLRRRRCH